MKEKFIDHHNIEEILGIDLNKKEMERIIFDMKKVEIFLTKHKFLEDDKLRFITFRPEPNRLVFNKNLRPAYDEVIIRTGALDRDSKYAIETISGGWRRYGVPVLKRIFVKSLTDEREADYDQYIVPCLEHKMFNKNNIYKWSLYLWAFSAVIVGLIGIMLD